MEQRGVFRGFIGGRFEAYEEKNFVRGTLKSVFLVRGFHVTHLEVAIETKKGTIVRRSVRMCGFRRIDSHPKGILIWDRDRDTGHVRFRPPRRRKNSTGQPRDRRPLFH